MLPDTLFSCLLHLLGLTSFCCDISFEPYFPLIAHAHNLTRGVHPLPCHSHNDEWRPFPLYTALSAGCISIEVDVWSFDGVDEIYVGHDANALTVNRTLKSMYIQPLVDMLDIVNAHESKRAGASLKTLHRLEDQGHKMVSANPVVVYHDDNRQQEDGQSSSHTDNKNEKERDAPKRGVFPSSPHTPLILLLDYKSSGTPLHAAINAHLAPLREKDYLTYYSTATGTLIPGPITVIATGSAPFDLIQAATESNSGAGAEKGKRDIFFDASLHRLDTDVNTSKFDNRTTFMASADFRSAVGRLYWPFYRLSGKQMERIRKQIRGARDKGLVSRYWGTPGWPRVARDHVWRVLVEEGVGVLCGDDVGAMAVVVGEENGRKKREEA